MNSNLHAIVMNALVSTQSVGHTVHKGSSVTHNTWCFGLTLYGGSTGDCCIKRMCAGISVVVKVTVSDSALSSITLHTTVVDGITSDC